MRLTLRTLLAYLDDTLEPAQAKLIGQKIAESPTALEIIARIKDVVRRRRLTTPPLTGPGAKIDPNTIAEYIDNVLPDEQLAEVEEVCLESDVHLAEIASCHQILTLILSEPVLVPPTAKQRMYGLIKGRESIPNRKVKPVVGAVAPESVLDRNEADETLLLGLPLYSRHGPWFIRLAPVAGVLFLVLALAWAIHQAVPFTSQPPGRTPENNSVAQSNQAGDLNGANPNEASKEKILEPKNRADADPPAVSTKPPALAPPSKEIHPLTPGTATETVRKLATGEGNSTPRLSVAPREERKALGKYVVGSIPSILLERSTDKDSWQRVMRDSSVYSHDQYESLPGYRSELRLDNGVQLLLWGDLPDGMSPVIVMESAVTIHADPTFDVDLTLDRGRISISNHKSDGPARARIRFLNEIWELTLLESGTEVVLELIGWPDVGFKKDPGKDEGPVTALGLFALQGQANLKVGLTTHFMKEPPGPARYVWSNVSGPAPGPQTVTTGQLPPWASKLPGGGKEAQAMRHAQAGLANRLGSKASVDVVLQETLTEDDPFSRILAVYCLGATENLSSLMDALSDERHTEVRIAAGAALRNWIGHKAINDLKLYKVLEDKYKSGPAEIMMELLHPYSDQQKRQTETYETFIAYLKHDKLPIRELAYGHLIALVPEGRSIPYDPTGGIDQREYSYEEWKKLIPTGKLPPKGNPPAGPPGVKKPDKGKKG